MPRLDALPHISIIRGLKGILDFYYWKGIPCVRKWPVIPPASRTPASLASAALFGAVVQGYSLLGGVLKLLFAEDAADQTRTARDLYVSAVLGHLHEINMDEVIALLEQNNAYLLALQNLLNTLNSIGTDLLLTMPANDGIDPQQLLVDAQRHLQADILASALPAGAATEAQLVTQTTALQLIDDLRNALETVHTDEVRTRPATDGADQQSLLVDGEGHLQVDILDLPDPFDVDNLRSAGYIHFASLLLGNLTATTKLYQLLGEKLTGITDNTNFDILQFTATSDASSVNSGVCSGWLTVAIRARKTTGLGIIQTIQYHITISAARVGSTFGLQHTTIASHERGDHPITVTLSGTGATKKYLKLQLKLTYPNWDANRQSVTWGFHAHSVANHPAYHIVPSVL